MIQTDLAKCLGNLMGKNNNSGNLSTDVNIVQREERVMSLMCTLLSALY